MKKFIAYLLMALCIMALFASCNSSAETDIYNNDSEIAKDGDNFGIVEYGSGEVDSGNNFLLTGFNGIKNIYSLKAKADSTVSVDYDLKTESGKFKYVYVDANKSIKVIVEKNGSGNLTLTVPKGDSIIKIVGAGANVDLTTDVKNSDGNVEIEYIN